MCLNMHADFWHIQEEKGLERISRNFCDVLLAEGIDKYTVG